MRESIQAKDSSRVPLKAKTILVFYEDDNNSLNHLEAFKNFTHCWNNPKRKTGGGGGGGKGGGKRLPLKLHCKVQICETYFKKVTPEQEVKNCHIQLVCDRLTCSRVLSGSINFISDYKITAQRHGSWTTSWQLGLHPPINITAPST